MELWRAVGRGVLLSAILLFGPGALILLSSAETTRGLAAGALGLLFTLTGALAFAGWRRPTVVAGAVSMAAFGGLLLWMPGPDVGTVGPIHSDPLPWALSQLVPEIDQVKVGVAAGRRLDPFIDGPQADRIAELVLPTYRTLGTEQRRSALTFGYAEVFGGAQRSRHRYWTVPERAPGAPRPPALIFLHGAAGNFLAYPAVFARLDAVVVLPTSGFGLYLDDAETARTITSARRFAVEELGADPERIFLAALSQGGVGATRFAKDRDDLRGLILLSAVVERPALEHWHGPDVLVLHGEADRRVPEDYGRATVAALATTTASVSAHFYPDEDHFLLYSKPDELIETMHAWMSRR